MFCNLDHDAIIWLHLPELDIHCCAPRWPPCLRPPTGWVCVWDVGPRGHRHHRGPAHRRRPLQHQDDSPQEEEQLQTPEEEGQAARGQYHTRTHHLFVAILPLMVGLRWVHSFFFFRSNLESPAPAVRTRPCCWPTAPRTNSDRTVWAELVNGGLANITIAMTKASPITPGCLAVTHLIHRVWLSIGHNLHRLHKGQLCIPPPFLRVPV